LEDVISECVHGEKAHEVHAISKRRNIEMSRSLIVFFIVLMILRIKKQKMEMIEISLLYYIKRKSSCQEKRMSPKDFV